MGQPLLDSGGLPLLDSNGYPLFLSGPLFFPSFIGKAWPVVRAPTFDTLVQRSYSGKKTSIARRGQAVYQYSLDINVLRIFSPADFQACFGFFNTLMGQWGSFYLDDVNDDYVTDELFGVGDGVTTQYQLARMYGYWTDFIFMTRGPAPIIKLNGATLFPGADYTIDNLGLVTYTAAPTGPMTWTGGYYWLCQLLIDQAGLSEFMSQMFEFKKLTFETVLLP